MLLTHRKLLQSKAIAIENDLRGTLRNFGLKVGMVGKVKFEAQANCRHRGRFAMNEEVKAGQRAPQRPLPAAQSCP